MRTRIPSSPAFAPMNSSSAPVAPPIARSRRAAVASERPYDRRAMLRKTIWSRLGSVTPIGFCEPAPLRYVPTFLGAHDIPAEYQSRRQTYVNLIINEMLPRVAEEKLAEYCDVFCEEGAFTSDESCEILSAARCHGLGLRVHADQLSLSGGAKLAAELNCATADHLEH